MADPYAVQMRFPWQWEPGGAESKGFFMMPVGTYKFLFPNGLPDAASGLPYSTYQQTQKTYTRSLYAGGPVVTVTRKPKTVRRVRSMTAMSARSDQKLILAQSGLLGSTQSTVYYTGPVWGAVAWLKANCQAVDNGSISIRGPKNQTYGAVDPTPAD